MAIKLLIGTGNAGDESIDFTIVCTVFCSDDPPPLIDSAEFANDFCMRSHPLTSRHLILQICTTLLNSSRSKDSSKTFCR